MKKRPSPQSDRAKSPMVVWDGLGLSVAHSGIGVYGAMLYGSLCKLGCEPYVMSFSDEKIPYVANNHHVQIPASSQNWAKRLLKLKPFYPIQTYREQKQLWPDDPVVYHGLSNLNLPLFSRRKPGDKFVISVHDLIPLHTNPRSALSIQMKLLLPGILARADRIITGSYWTKIQLVERFGVHIADKVENLAYGTMKPEWKASTWDKRTIDVLTIARGEEYKRLYLIVEMAKRRPECKFALVTDDSGARAVAHRPPNLNVYSHISRAKIEELYSDAKVMVHPSLYEGWCLPAADALSRSLYLIYCRGSGIDEVAAYAQNQSYGLSRDATVDDWTNALSMVLDIGDFKVDQANLPSWSEIASKTLKIYQSLL